MSSYIFLLIIALLGAIGKNNILIYSSLTLCIFKLFPYSDKILRQFKLNGLNFGIYIITVAILVPIAIGTIGFEELKTTIMNYKGIVAILMGIVASILATKGIFLQSINPEIVVFVSVGTIFGIALFGGTAVGPIVASGITYFVLVLIEGVIK